MNEEVVNQGSSGIQTSKVSLLRFLALSSIFASLVIGFYVGTRYSKSPSINFTDKSQLVPTSTSKPTKVAPFSDYEIYLGKIENSLALFQKNTNGGPFFQGYAGVGRDHVGLNLKFDQATDVKRILERQPGEVYSFLTDKQEKYIYLSVVTKDFNSIWRVDLNNYREDEVYLKRFYNSAVHINKIEGKYLELSSIGCYGCGGDPSDGSKLILNAENGGVLWLGDVGDVIIQENTKSVTYKRLSWVEEECDIGLMCDSGKWTIRKPIGTVYSERLPGNGYSLEQL